MRFYCKKLAVILLTGMLVFSGLVQPSIARAEELNAQSDSMSVQDNHNDTTDISEDLGTESSIPNADVKDNGSYDATYAADEPQAEEIAVVMTQGDKTIGSYKSVGDAIKDVLDYSYSLNKTEYVIKLQKDIQEDIVIPVKKKIAINLNGHKITNVSSHTIYNNSTNIRVLDSIGGGCR